MKTKPVEESGGPEAPPPFKRRVVLGGWQAVGLAVVMAVPALALAEMLGDRVEQRVVRQAGWILNADVPVCSRDGAALKITVRLSREDAPAALTEANVELSPEYLSRFTEVKRRPAVFGTTEESAASANGQPVVIELTPDRCGWARGRLGVTTGTGVRMELELKTFVFP